MIYIAISDVNTHFEVTDETGWAGKSSPTRCVNLANLWLSSKNLPEENPIPDAWIAAGCEIAAEIAKGNIYKKKETGVLSKSVSASSVSVSKSYESGSQEITAGEQIALDLLAPWLNTGFSNIILLKKM